MLAITGTRQASKSSVGVVAVGGGTLASGPLLTDAGIRGLSPPQSPTTRVTLTPGCLGCGPARLPLCSIMYRLSAGVVRLGGGGSGGGSGSAGSARPAAAVQAVWSMPQCRGPPVLGRSALRAGHRRRSSDRAGEAVRRVIGGRPRAARPQ